MRFINLASLMLAGSVGLGLLIATCCFVSCVGNEVELTSGSSEAEEEENWTDVDAQLFKSGLPPQSPEKTIELLKRSHALGSGPAFTEDWRRSGLLVRYSINEPGKCKEDFLKELKSIIENKFRDYNRIVDYLDYCREKQLAYCRDNFNYLVMNSIEALTEKEKSDTELLFDIVVRDSIDLKSFQAIQQIRPEFAYTGVLNFLEIKNGKFTALDFEQNDEGSTQFENFREMYFHSIWMLCKTLERKFEEAIFTLEEAQPDLDDDEVQEWMARVRLCKDLSQAHFIKGTYSYLLERPSSSKKGSSSSFMKGWLPKGAN